MKLDKLYNKILESYKEEGWDMDLNSENLELSELTDLLRSHISSYKLYHILDEKEEGLYNEWVNEINEIFGFKLTMSPWITDAGTPPVFPKKYSDKLDWKSLYTITHIIQKEGDFISQ